MVNSIGVFRMIQFLRTVPDGVTISYAHCPVPFINQLNLAAEPTSAGKTGAFVDLNGD